MATLTPITLSGNCVNCSAGISQLWATDCDNVANLSFNTDEAIDAIVMNAAAVFTLIQFEQDTAFLTQEKTAVGFSKVVTQTVQFIEPCMSPEVRKALRALNSCCCLHAIVKDNTSKYHYVGISVDDYNADADIATFGTYTDKFLIASTGSGNTGTDPTNDSNQFTENLIGTVNFYAPFFVAGEGAIPV